MNKQIKIIILLFVVLKIVACQSSTVAPPVPVNVEVKQVVQGDAFENFAYSGTIEESETIPLSFSVTGSVVKVFVTEGDTVKRGQLLATLDNTTFKNSYEIALAAMKQAEDASKRLSRMYANGNLPEIKYVEVQTKLNQAKATLMIAKKNLEDCNLYASTGGIVGKRSIEPGMMATPNLTSITLVKIGKVYARVPVSENEISTIKKGARAKIKISALASAAFEGTIEEIGVMADPLAHTYIVKIGIQNPKQMIKPGMVCNVTIADSQGRRTLIVPGEAVLVDEVSRNFVYAVDETQNKAVRKFVKIGKIVQTGIEIIDGLQEGEFIITKGQHKLVDHSYIHIINP